MKSLKGEDYLRRKTNNKFQLLFVAFLLLLIVNACDFLPPNSNPPSYIKQFTVYKEGHDGVMVYFILADSSGEMTTYDGNISLKITTTHYAYKEEIVLYETGYTISKSDFKKNKLGIGAFSRNAIVFSFGRIPYSWFRNDMGKVITNNWRGKARLEFTFNNSRLRSEETFFF